jgi:hypothetical protein
MSAWAPMPMRLLAASGSGTSSRRPDFPQADFWPHVSGSDTHVDPTALAERRFKLHTPNTP